MKRDATRQDKPRVDMPVRYPARELNASHDTASILGKSRQMIKLNFTLRYMFL